MDTRTKKISLFSTSLAIVHGPAFLSVVSLVLLLATIPADAALLRGYVCQDISRATSPAISQSTNTNASSLITVTESSASLANSAQNMPPENAPENNVKTSNLGLEKALLREDSFPSSFQGTWRCITVVVDSAVASVPVGQKLQADMQFVPSRDGRVVARWAQPGWTETKAQIDTVSPTEASLDRTNYYAADGITGWAAHSSDHYVQIDANRISAQSAVDQYEQGQYLGQYRTKSMLFRVPTRHLAMGTGL